MSSSSEILVQVTAPHFCATLVMLDDVVIEAAPILRWTIGKRRRFLRRMFERKGWRAVVLTGCNSSLQ